VPVSEKDGHFADEEDGGMILARVADEDALAECVADIEILDRALRDAGRRPRAIMAPCGASELTSWSRDDLAWARDLAMLNGFSWVAINEFEASAPHIHDLAGLRLGARRNAPRLGRDGANPEAGWSRNRSDRFVRPLDGTTPAREVVDSLVRAVISDSPSARLPGAARRASRPPSVEFGRETSVFMGSLNPDPGEIMAWVASEEDLDDCVRHIWALEQALREIGRSVELTVASCTAPT
jgi:hypothetical protein